MTCGPPRGLPRNGCVRAAVVPAHSGPRASSRTGARHGDSRGGRGPDRERVERPAGIPAQPAVVPADVLHQRGFRPLDRLRNRHPHGASVALVEKDLDATAGSVRPRFPACRGSSTTAAQAVKDALDVLAGPEAVGAMVPALARVDVRVQRTDLHRVGAAALRCDPVIAEGMRTLIEYVYLDNLGAPAPLPAADLVRIRRDPSLKRWRPVILQTPASRGGFPSHLVHVVIRFAGTGYGTGARPSVFTAPPTIQGRHHLRPHATKDAGRKTVQMGPTHPGRDQRPC